MTSLDPSPLGPSSAATVTGPGQPERSRQRPPRIDPPETGPIDPVRSPHLPLRRRTPLAAPPPLPSDLERLGWSPPPEGGSSGRRRARPSGLARVVRLLFLATLVASFLFAATNQDLIRALSTTPQWQEIRQDGRNLVHAAVSIVAEEPAFAAADELSAYPICVATSRDNEDRIERGMDLMRATDEGERLFDQLVENEICVGTEDIGYNSGYAYGRQSSTDGSWSDSYIIVASDLLGSNETDVLAALLIHEATHIDRYINDVACNFRDSCTTLPNGVDLEEEIAAHGAEAEWWIAAYGSDGKRFATGRDYGVNRLARAYGEGPDVFDAYVQRIRSDAREGSMLAD